MSFNDIKKKNTQTQDTQEIVNCFMKVELGRCGAKSVLGHGLCLHLAAQGCSGQPSIKVVACQIPSVMLTVSGLFIRLI